MLIGKLKYLIEPERGHTIHCFDIVPIGTWRVQEQPLPSVVPWIVGLCARGQWPYSMKQE
jgi:hypothetical protein